jgi:murein DD-endopeptidase MepM/ murein hydrolase activator NlpD
MLYALVPFVTADEVDELKEKIDEQNRKIQQIEEEIKEYEEELVEIGEEKASLQNTIYTLDISRKKISADINLTENRIDSTALEINRLALDITDKEGRIRQNQAAIADTLRNLNEIESDSLVEIVLANDNLTEVWERIETMERFQFAMQEDIHKLLLLKTDLEVNKEQSEEKREELEGYKSQLSGQKQVLDQNRQEKSEILTVTANKEASYQQLLEEKRAAREQFERELQDFESQLEFALDPNSIPPTGQGALAWPLDSTTITQYFGNTQFAQSGAYNGSGHNGVDFRASTGTRVKASLNGIVTGTGDTDQVRGCYSYGKWVLVKHNNGLSTLYAHLSVINVSEGQHVATGEVLGFSGNTGYSTGPHLHYSVYLSDAVRVVRLGDVKTITNCGAARIPVAPLAAYLNPLDYLRNVDKLRSTP